VGRRNSFLDRDFLSLKKIEPDARLLALSGSCVLDVLSRDVKN
jgi:hypothetical protein